MDSARGNFSELDESDSSLYAFNLQLFILQPTVSADMEFSQSDGLPFVAAVVCQVEALQREVCVRNTHWQQQRQREEDILSDLDSALFQHLFRVTEANLSQVGRGSLLIWFGEIQICRAFWTSKNEWGDAWMLWQTALESNSSEASHILLWTGCVFSAKSTHLCVWCLWSLNWVCVRMSFFVCQYANMCLYFSCSKCKCVLCCRSSGQGGSWGKQPWSCRIQRRLRPRGEQLSTPTWLWSCLHMYYASSHWVNCLASCQNEKREGYYTHGPCAAVAFSAFQSRGASHMAPFIWTPFKNAMLYILFALAAHLCASLSLCIGDGEEWDQQCVWYSELVSGLDKVDVCMEQWQQDQEKWTSQEGDWATSLQAMVRIMGNFFSPVCKMFHVPLRPSVPNDSWCYGEFWKIQWLNLELCAAKYTRLHCCKCK